MSEVNQENALVTKIRVKPSSLNSFKYFSVDKNIQKNLLMNGNRFDLFIKQIIIPFLPNVYPLNENVFKTSIIKDFMFEIVGQADGIFIDSNDTRIVLEFKWVDFNNFKDFEQWFNYGWCFQCISYCELYNTDVVLIVFTKNRVLDIRTFRKNFKILDCFLNLPTKIQYDDIKSWCKQNFNIVKNEDLNYNEILLKKMFNVALCLYNFNPI